MRLFVAVLPPNEALDALGRVVAEVRGMPGTDGLRWTEPAGWHLTLAFLGEVDESLLPALDERLGRACRRYGPYQLRLAGGGLFANRTLWAGAQGDLAGMARLARAVRGAARKAGAPPDEEHGFHPHLTLARARRPTEARLKPLAEVLDAYQGPAWTADTVVLVRSHPPEPGVPGAQPRYQTRQTWPLGRRLRRRPDGRLGSAAWTQRPAPP
jgi:RNA 2',3'-cyclic 3'-phosphodiesterase